MKRGYNDMPWISEAFLEHPDGHKDILYKNDKESPTGNDEIVRIINNSLENLNLHPEVEISDALKNMKTTTYDINGNTINNDTTGHEYLPAELLNLKNKRNKDQLQRLDNILANIYSTQQKHEEVMKLSYEDYKKNINLKNDIIVIHNQCIDYVNSRGIQFWKSYDDSSIYYRVNSYMKKKKFNNDDLHSLLNTHVKIYKTIEHVELFDNTLLLISDFLSTVKDDIFDPSNDIEWVIYNNLKYRNTFQYTIFLQKRFLPMEIQQLEQQLQPQGYQTPQYALQSMNQVSTIQQEVQLLNPHESVQNKSIIMPLFPQTPQLQNLKQQLEIKDSIITDFIYHLSKNEYQFNYIMNWLAHFFQTLNKSGRAIVLIGDNETTDILINKIIRPIFAYKKEYFAVIDNGALKKSTNTIIKDRIFYHIDTDNLEPKNIKSSQLSKLLKELIKINSSSFIQAKEQDETYIYGETIVTSSNESPYPFLKNSYSRCSVFNVAHIDTILKKINIGLLELEELIENDLDNFASILVQYQTDRQYFTIAQTDEKNALPNMKKGILLTPMLESQIQRFIDAIKRQDKIYFKPLELEDNKNLYKELVENFDKDDAIYQPKLAEYFNIVNEDIIFSDNSHFIEILKERECLFNQAADDKFKLNGQRRYKIFKYKLAKNYQGNCENTI